MAFGPDQFVPPVLVLGLGNVLLGDDGVGPALLREVCGLYAGVPGVECVDGGTQGMALLGYLAGREAVIILDAYAGGQNAGVVSVLEGPEVLGGGVTRSTTAHEGNAGELLAIAQLLGELPERIFLVGIEPERVRTELGLSERVASALPGALVRTCGVVEQVLAELRAEMMA
ncbi:MAG: hydrogenase maturation protease [Acidobacteriia bacterium]|nr:hydrogenase maturation protease [Terriglobia bacterium]